MQRFTNHRLSHVILSVVTMLGLTWSGHGETILEIHSDALTDYQAGVSNVQDIGPQMLQRGVNIDGTLRHGSTVGMAINGNPYGTSLGGQHTFSGVRLDVGTYVVNEVDIALPADIPWIIGRTYNTRQLSGGSHHDSSGYQGVNWFQTSQPELVFYDSQTDSEDLIYLVYGADRYVEFRRADDQGSGDSTDTFRATNGASGVILLHTFDGCDLATLYDQKGYRYDFFWFNDADIDDDIEGSLWRIMDATVEVDPYDTGDRLAVSDGNVAYFGNVGNPNTAQTSGYNADGTPKEAYDSEWRRFTYSYASGQLTEVEADLWAGSWITVARVAYSYYVNADTYGEDNDLKLVEVDLTPESDMDSHFSTTYYRYYEGTYNATTNPGYHHQLQYIIAPEGFRRRDQVADPLTTSENDLKSYASGYFAYDTSYRVVSAWFGGACGCAGGISGTMSFTYEDNGSFSNTSGYDTTWKSRTIVELPSVLYKTADGSISSFLTQYFDEVGQPLSTVRTKLTPSDTSGSQETWASRVDRNASGVVTSINQPSIASSYTHSTGVISANSSSGYQTMFSPVSSGDLTGFPAIQYHKEGWSGTAYRDVRTLLTSRAMTVGDSEVRRAMVSGRYVYYEEQTTGTSGSDYTSSSYTWHSATASSPLYIMPKQITTTMPTVTTAQNGSNTANTIKRYLRKDGSTAFTEAADGIFTYTRFDGGQLVERIDDVKTNGTFATGDDPNTDFGITETGDGWDRSTTYAYDSRGRLTTVTPPSGPVQYTHYSYLADDRQVTLHYADFDVAANPDRFYGPIQYNVVNLAGRSEVQGMVELSSSYTETVIGSHVDETDSDPVTAIDGIGTLARMNVTIYNDAGSRASETRNYFLIPASGLGTDGTNYDTVTYAYDDQGRQVRVEQPSGTVSRTDYDTLGRPVASWIGMNDYNFDNGDTSGSDTMVKTVAMTYDAGSDGGDSHLTKRTAYVEDSDTDKRETTYAYDYRGRMLLQTNPEAPHVFIAYDTMGRQTAQGLYGSTAYIDITVDTPVTETKGRKTLSQSYHDALGRVWKTTTHKINQTTGATSDSLTSQRWYDAAGRAIKSTGTQISKSFYDRIGRPTHQFVLAEINDSGYTDADDVSGDIVLTESQTTYESNTSDLVIMSASIERFHDDKGGGETTGALDTNADGDALKYTAANLEGRIQISATWYDDLHRPTSTVRYGTYGGSDFDRDGLSVPARSDTALRTDYAYSYDGTRLSVTDPKDVETRFLYDDAGRTVATIRNYVDGTPSGDSDHYTRSVYVDGLQTKMWVDLDGDDVVDTDDQVTEYVYGTTKGATAGDSKVATGHLLQETKYPDTSGATDTVTQAYNAQGQVIWTEDQGENVTEMVYDDAGRLTIRKLTTLDTETVTDAESWDDAVLRVEYAYDNMGRRSTVTQYDAATSGNVVDEVKYTYDEWSNITKIEQDLNSTVATGGTLLYDVQWAYAKATTSWENVRRSSITLPDNTTITYEYLSANDRFDAATNRVTRLNEADSFIVTYDYNGVGHVVGTEYATIDVMRRHYGSTSGDYPDYDRFNRLTSDRWTKDLATDKDFFDLDLTYDRNGNITFVEDAVFSFMSAAHTYDALNRLTDTDMGVASGGSITTLKYEERWTLDQLGNWTEHYLDLNGDGTITTANGDLNEDNPSTGASAHFNEVNEQLERDIDDDGTTDYTLVYNTLGQMTDDGEHYEYLYDGFGRLRKITNRVTDALVAEYRYNGLGHRIGVHEDFDADGDVDANDPWHYYVYDAQWRSVAIYEDTESDSRETFVYHSAGQGGYGSSSYMDDVVRRKRDTDDNGSLDETVFYCQNWRHDVVALVDASDSDPLEHLRTSPYGVPIGIPAGDIDQDGAVDTDDETYLAQKTPAYLVRADVVIDGLMTSADKTRVTGDLGTSLGYQTISNVENRKGSEGNELSSRTVSSQAIMYSGAGYSTIEYGRSISRVMSYALNVTYYYSMYSTNPEQYPQSPYFFGINQDSSCNWSSGGKLAKCFEKNPLVILAYNEFIDACFGSDPSYPVSITCTDESGSATPANFDCVSRVITLNQGWTCTALAEELLHAADLCRRDPDCSDISYGFIQGCSLRMCTEARAAAYIRCCDKNDPVRKKTGSWRKCVNGLRDAWIARIIENPDLYPECSLFEDRSLRRSWEHCIRNLSERRACNRSDDNPIPPIHVPVSSLFTERATQGTAPECHGCW